MAIFLASHLHKQPADPFVPLAPEAFDRPLLHEARSADDVNSLCDGGVDLNARDVNGQTPLFSVTSPEALSALLDRGAMVNVRDSQGSTPLHYAAARIPGVGIPGSETRDACLEVLVKAGAYVDAQDVYGSRPTLTHDELSWLRRIAPSVVSRPATLGALLDVPKASSCSTGIKSHAHKGSR